MAKTTRKAQPRQALQPGEIDGVEVLRRWFSTQGYQPFSFQEEAWMRYRRGESGLIQVPTGAGKTYAAYGGPLSELFEHPEENLQILIVTPLRALSRDMEKALKLPIENLK